MIDLSEFASNIKEIEDGIWMAKDDGPSISYPLDGNDLSFKLEELSFWFKHRNNCIIAGIENFPPTGMMYDVGGGNGFLCKGIIDNGFQCILIEPNISGVRNARKRGLKPVICSTLENAGFKERSLSALGLFDVLEHIEEDEKYLIKLKSFLKLNGYLYLTVPAYQFLWSTEDIIAGHYRRYTLKSLKKKLEKAGYSIKYATYFFSFLPLPIFLFRSIPSKIGLRKKKMNYQISGKEHSGIKKGSLVDVIFSRYLEFEVNAIKKKKKIPFGGSCFIVAQSR